MEKHCLTCYSEDFIDPGSNLAYGEWLKATLMGETSGGVRLSLQPIPSPDAPLNIPSTSLISTNFNEVRMRKVVTPSATRNRKSKKQTHFNEVDEITGRPSKRKLIGGTDDFVEVLVGSPTNPSELFIFEL